MQPAGSPATKRVVPGYYAWDAPGGRVAVHLKLEVIDRLLPGVMAGFGAVPKRGAEIGGVLLGSVESGDITVIRIEDFEQVPCRYKRGPSYLLSDQDFPAFEATIAGYAGGTGGLRPVGFYRSHTRESLAIGEDDRILCARFFPSPDGVVLLIRPYATKTSTAGFLTYQDGALADWPTDHFPFRRSELAGIDIPAIPQPAGRPMSPAHGRNGNVPVVTPGAPHNATQHPDIAENVPHQAVPIGFTFGGYVDPEPDTRPSGAAQARPGRRWIWMPLSFILMFAGVLLGYFAATSGFLAGRAVTSDPYALSLTATRNGDNLWIRWNRQAEAIRQAKRGTLHIADGATTKDVELSAGELQTGTVIFHGEGAQVSVRLEVFLDGAAVSNIIDWRR